jgi:acyl-CoA thioesterase-1
MNKQILRIIVVLVVCGFLAAGCASNNVNKPINPANYKETIRVACIGDSITAEGGTRSSYPVQLGRLLGDKWEVRNFGVSGTTMLKKGDFPYWRTPALQKAQDYNPNVIIIKLGTNDSKPQNWKYKDEFFADYADMLSRFAELPSKPRIWICYPLPVFKELSGINDPVIKNEVIPIISQVARQTHVGVIDLYKPFVNHPELSRDGVHPNADGSALMAKQVYTVLTGLKAP